MAEKNLAGRVEFGKARLASFGDLEDKSALELQRKIAGADVLLKVSIQDPKTSDALRERLVYYYGEVTSYYYQSKSNDIKKLTQEIVPQLLELEEDIRNDNNLHTDFHKNPLLDIIAKTNENIKAKLSLSGRIASKARKVLDLPVGGVIAAAATKSPLIGLAVAAYEFSQKKKKKSGNTVFHKEQALDEKLLERASLKTDADSSPGRVLSEDIMAPESSSSSRSSGPDFAKDDAELKAYIDSMKPGQMTPATSSRNQGQASLNLSPVVAILNKHTNLLGGTYRNTQTIVSILRGKPLSEEEALGEKKSASLFGNKEAKTTTATKAFDFLSKIKSVISKIGPGVMAAVGAVIPTIAAALPGLATAAVIAVGGSLGWAIGSAIEKMPGVRKILDWFGGIDKNEAQNKKNAQEASNLGKIMQYKRSRGIGTNAELQASFARDRAASLGQDVASVPETATVAPPPAPPAPTAIPAPSPAPAPKPPSAAPITQDQEPLAIPKNSELPINYDEYAKAIGKRESGGKYNIENSLGFLGKYQMGAASLEDLGLIKKGTFAKHKGKGSNKKIVDNPENWTITGGKKAFLDNPDLQERTMEQYTKRNFKTLVRLGKIKKDSDPAMIAGWLGASHLLGPGVKDLSKEDAYGTKGAEYYALGNKTQSPSISLASLSGDSNQTGRREITTAVSQSPASNQMMPPIVLNTNNQNTSMFGGGGGFRMAGIPAPVDNSPVVRQLVGS